MQFTVAFKRKLPGKPEDIGYIAFDGNEESILTLEGKRSLC